MASLTVASRLARLEEITIPQGSKREGYHKVLSDIVATGNHSLLQDHLIAFVNSVFSDTLGIVTARTILSTYVEALAHLSDLTVKIGVCQHTLQALEPRLASFEDQDARIREILADAYQESEDYVGAAKALQGIQLESSQRKISDTAKVKTWIRICRLYLEEDDTTSAESYLNRAKALLYKVDDIELNLIFQLSQARIFDSRRKFLEASQTYHTVSLAVALAEEERLATLSKAIICSVLAPAGPARTRSLGKLYNDERSVRVEEYSILEKMFLQHTISPSEVASFSQKLAPHQLARTADGSTVLAKAVVEHNLLGASTLYKNLAITELGRLLALDAPLSERYAARMLEQGRLSGSIDQIDGVIHFEDQTPTDSKDKTTVGLSPSGVLRHWNEHVQGLIEDAERVSFLLQ